MPFFRKQGKEIKDNVLQHYAYQDDLLHYIVFVKGGDFDGVEEVLVVCVFSHT